jgi:hypothetical protein
VISMIGWRSMNIVKRKEAEETLEWQIRYQNLDVREVRLHTEVGITSP